MGYLLDFSLLLGWEVHNDGKVCHRERAWVEAQTSLVLKLVRIRPVRQDHHVWDGVHSQGMVKIPVDGANRKGQRRKVPAINHSPDQLQWQKQKLASVQQKKCNNNNINNVGTNMLPGIRGLSVAGWDDAVPLEFLEEVFTEQDDLLRAELHSAGIAGELCPRNLGPHAFGQ